MTMHELSWDKIGNTYLKRQISIPIRDPTKTLYQLPIKPNPYTFEAETLLIVKHTKNPSTDQTPLHMTYTKSM